MNLFNKNNNMFVFGLYLQQILKFINYVYG